MRFGIDWEIKYLKSSLVNQAYDAGYDTDLRTQKQGDAKVIMAIFTPLSGGDAIEVKLKFDKNADAVDLLSKAMDYLY